MLKNSVIRNLESSWKVKNDKALTDVFFVSPDEEFSITLNDIEVENCVCLVSHEFSERSPKLRVTVAQPVTSIDIISEAQLIEFYGNNDEYLASCHGDFIDDWEGLSVFQVKLSTSPLLSLMLKFSRIKEEGRLWIYGIALQIKEVKVERSLLFNIENVSKLLNNNASEKAAKFMNFLHLYSKSANVQGSEHVPNTSCDSRLQKQSFGNYFQNSCHGAQTLVKMEKQSGSDTKDMTAAAHCSPEQSNFELSPNYVILKNYLDNRLDEMEAALFNKLESNFNQLLQLQNEHFNKIVSLLENSNKKP